MTKDYYLGLDLGTGSLGWAVTDKNYEVLRMHGKSLWGVRLFESANTAEERRIFRTSRRRLDRRNHRIELLQELLSEEISKVDPGFYLRMKESKYSPEDKRDINGKCPELPYSLFMDPDFTDKDYHKKFPTIYHLRHYLMTTDETPDIRLLYLALHHLMKHRGHFLLSGDINEIKEFSTTFGQFLDCINDEELDWALEDSTTFSAEDYVKIEELLCDKNTTKSTKKSLLIKYMKATTACEKSLLSLIVGGKVKLSDIFSDPDLNNLEKKELSFSDSNFDEYISNIENDIGERFIIIAKAKAVYDWSVLADILGNHQSISEAKVELYEKHKNDLIFLKKLVHDNCDKELYKELFVNTDEKLCNYSAYIGMTKKNGSKVALAGKQCSKEDFYTYLKKNILVNIADSPEVQYVKNEIEKETFLPKQVTKDNSVIPYQIHLYELNRILDNLCNRIPILAQNANKIRQIFTFRIPYYVGPLNGVTRGNESTNWMVRKPGNEHEKIYPWNFKEIVDTEACAETFIRRMTNKCTYLIHEDVLPKNSLLYSKFMVLNELNNLRIKGVPIDVNLKQRIYSELFQRTRKVTQKKLRDFLVAEKIIPSIERKTVDITGIDGDFKSSLVAYHDFKEKLTNCILSDREKEKIILNITLFGEDKKLLKKRLSTLYPDLSDAQLKALCSLNYSGWGRLSREFLEGITAPAPETGEVWTIIRTMWETNDNMMQVLSEKYQFISAIDDANGLNESKTITYQAVEELYVSPAVKRQIWQTLQVVKELCKVMDVPPKRIFVEMAREKAESKRTDSRKKKLTDLYKKCKDEERDWIDELSHTDDSKLRSDKLYLYYTQKGRCMYSGEVIDLDELWDNTKYDIDHIYPQSKVMDDSLDNRVLVKKIYNAEKTDRYPIAKEIRDNRQSFWKSLLDGGFISKEKYARLIRSNEFEPSELAGFIQRQLVETRQGTKAVASILKQLLPDTQIVYVKARITSQFRQDFDLLKVREMNDFHHAKDAYLNVVVGNTYFTKFTQNASWYIKEHPGRSYNLKKMFTGDKDVERGGEVAWKAGANGTIKTVKRVMQKNNILVTRRSYTVKGGLFKQQILKKGKGQVPIKGSDERLLSIDKYGGYDKAAGTYFMLVESKDKKGNKIRTIEFVPLYLCEQIEKDYESAISYLINDRKLISPRILLSKIKIDTLFKVDGFYMWLSGRTENRLIFKGAIQLVLSTDDTVTLKKVLKFVTRHSQNKDIKIVAHDNLCTDSLVTLYDSFLDKIKNTIYHSRLSAQETTLTQKRETFCALSDEDKCIVLSEILHMFQCQSTPANLKLIGGPSSAGILVLNNNVTKCNQISIINQSPTGIYEQEIDLLKV